MFRLSPLISYFLAEFHIFTGRKLHYAFFGSYLEHQTIRVSCSTDDIAMDFTFTLSEKWGKKRD